MSVYLPNPSAKTWILYKIKILAKLNRFEYRVFIFQHGLLFQV